MEYFFEAHKLLVNANDVRIVRELHHEIDWSARIIGIKGFRGVGKTTFVQGLARGFGITEPVTSPTFNIYTVHHAREAGGRTLVHLDAYRLDHPKQVEDLLLEDFLVSPWCLAVEWPEKIPGWLPPGALQLDLGIAADERHTLKLR